MHLPEEIQSVLLALRQIGRPLIVGGAVRDWLLGFESKDLDIEVGRASFDEIHRALAPFGATDVVGKSFGVIKLRLGSGSEYDISIPRRESKTGAGHRGFAIAPDPDLNDADALARRDFTVNSIAWDPFGQKLIDPHGGETDLHARRLRHTSSAFTEDPLRVLRAMQLAARFDLTLAPQTASLCHQIAAAYVELPIERVWHEWAKWAEKSTRPSRGLAVLKETGWLAHFPELAALDGCPQDPEWHPEGDVLTHTAHCCDALAAQPEWLAAPPPPRLRLMLAALRHDAGKPSCTRREEKPSGSGQLRWVSPGHEPAGVGPAESFLRRIGAPLNHAPIITPLIANHMVHHHGGLEGLTHNAVRRLARRLHPATIDDLALVMRADSLGRPPLHSPETLRLINNLLARAHQLALADSAPRPILLGRHLIAAGLAPGPEFKKFLEAAFEAQLDGTFADESTALIWLSNNMPDSISGHP